MAEICKFQRLEHGPTEKHIWLPEGEAIPSTRAIKLHSDRRAKN